ncbi:uncharacterized protein [Montipora foliosa]|uniref:uncharacterized protein n=1 Tax=Montipora foliosa TaxID=591990 RepID=UPI0035F133A9
MVRLPYRDEQLNFFKFTSIVKDDFPEGLRQIFVSLWNNNFGSTEPWDDTVAVRKSFLAKEGGKTKVPTNESYENWDCTALVQAIIHAKCFSVVDSKGHRKTLSDMYLKPRSLPSGHFHSSVESSTGDKAETYALAIDQLRLLRNFICHSAASEMDKKTFDKYMQYAKEAFTALGLKTDRIDDIGNLNESQFPTKEVAKLKQGNRIMKIVLFI